MVSAYKNAFQVILVLHDCKQSAGRTMDPSTDDSTHLDICDFEVILGCFL